jgi:membrane protein YqaA with SNARE-associated domain
MHETMSVFLLNLVQRRSFARRLLAWLRHLGGPGLILLGIVDNSVIPVPGSMDALTIVLAANQRDWWPYYAAMATAGSLLGGYLTYRLAQKEGADKIEKRVPGKTWRKVQSTFKRWGFGAVATAALLPPPAPMVPFLLAAGAAKYSRKKFLGALATGRGVRYTVLSFLSAMYGRRVLRALMRHGRPVVMAMGIVVAVAIVTTLLLRGGKRKSAQHA